MYVDVDSVIEIKPDFRILNSYIIDLSIEGEPSIITIDIDKIINSILQNKKILLRDCVLPKIYDEVIEKLKIILENKIKNSELLFSKEFGNAEISEDNKKLCTKYAIDSFDKLIKSEINHPAFLRMKEQTNNAKKYLELCLIEKKI